MKPLSEIEAESREWAQEAARKKREPFVFFNDSDVHPPWDFPLLGEHVPECWELVEELFCDLTGLGSESEPALTTKQLEAKIRGIITQPGTYGFGLISVGQFQGTVGVYKRKD